MSEPVQAFTPGALITIDDVMTSTRKLALVTDMGQTYIDSDDADATPLPIWNALKPENVGNIMSWQLYLMDREPQHFAAFRALCTQLINSGEGFLTYNRAAYWAFVKRGGDQGFDFDRALAVGREQTQVLAAGRQTLDAWVDRYLASSAATGSASTAAA